MPNSTRILIQDTPGHTSLALGMGRCLVKALKAYYLDGELPENERHCEGDRGIFDDFAVEAEDQAEVGLRQKLERASKAFLRERV